MFEIKPQELVDHTEYHVCASGLLYKLKFVKLDGDNDPLFYNNSMNTLVKYNSKYGWLFYKINKINFLLDILSHKLLNPYVNFSTEVPSINI